MTFAAQIFTLAALLFSVPNTANAYNIVNDVTAEATGDGANVNVRINNSLGQQSTTSYTKSNTTSVHISQTGDGESSVVINDKEWKLDGPGEINITETSDPESENGTERAGTESFGDNELEEGEDDSILVDEYNESASDTLASKKPSIKHYFEELFFTLRSFFANLF